MNIKIYLKEILKYLDKGLLNDAFKELAVRSDENELKDMQKYIMGCLMFCSSPEKKK